MLETSAPIRVPERTGKGNGISRSYTQGSAKGGRPEAVFVPAFAASHHLLGPSPKGFSLPETHQYGEDKAISIARRTEVAAVEPPCFPESVSKEGLPAFARWAYHQRHHAGVTSPPPNPHPLPTSLASQTPIPRAASFNTAPPLQSAPVPVSPVGPTAMRQCGSPKGIYGKVFGNGLFKDEDVHLLLSIFASSV